MPITYDDRNAVHALQWAIGLEWFLLAATRGGSCCRTDHPNGGSFLAYPQIIGLLMDRELSRRAMLGAVNQQAAAHASLLDDLAREYTLSEIAIITRAGPARMLGLRDKGHLGAGADADVTIYAPDDDTERMFPLPATSSRTARSSSTMATCARRARGRRCSRRRVRPGVDPELEALFDGLLSMQFANFPVRRAVGCVEPATLPSAAGDRDELRGAAIADTFAEAFPMTARASIDHGRHARVGRDAARAMTGTRRA